MLRPRATTIFGKAIPAAVAAILVLTACGSDPSPSDAGSVTADASATESSGDDGLIAPRPVNLSGNSGGAVSAAAESAPTADMAVDSKMMPYQITNFVAGEGLGSLPTNDIGYVFEAGTSVTPEQVSQLAAALGVEGEAERIDDGYSVWWRVGPDDGTAPSVSVYEDSQLSWNYNSAWATQSVNAGGGCAVAGSEGSAVTPAVEPATDPAVDTSATPAPAPDTKPMPIEPACEFSEPEPPAGIPTADEAEAPVSSDVMPVDDSVPVETMPTPEPEQITVTLTSVESDVWWAWDVDGTVWLLPAYRFIGEDGGWYTVPAVTDEFLVQVPSDSVPVPEPMPVETVPVETVPVETVPVETVPVESTPVDTTPVTDPALFESSQLDGAVGSTLDKFTAAAEALGATVRVIEIDGVSQAATMDFLTNRVNVAVTGDPADPTTSTVITIINVG